MSIITGDRPVAAVLPKDQRSLLPIAVVGLCAEVDLDFDLYLRPGGSATALLYRERNVPLRQDDLARLLEHNVQTLYIHESDLDAFQGYLRREIIRNERISLPQRYSIFRKATQAVFQAAFQSHHLATTVEIIDDFAHQLTELLAREKFLTREFFSLMEHDYYTYTHVLNVSTYAIILANHCGFNGANELQSIAAGALLHDIGKKDIDRRLLRKSGKLDEKQRLAIRNHPRIGFEMLSACSGLAWGQRMMVYQHHEQCNGGGYPVGITREEIHPWARLTAIVDVFDALTTYRAYHKPLSLSRAMDYLQNEAGTTLDKELTTSWIRIASWHS
jgi:putative nucleotidyltransferase with HDIG domain